LRLEKTLEAEITENKIGPRTEHILRVLFSDPAIIIISSAKGSKTWKTGKTDTSLRLAEDAIALGLFDEVATNIDTFGAYEYIQYLDTLKIWLFKDKLRKCFILDEANTHLPSRRAMSDKSVSIIEVFPEISKARAVLIVVGQDREAFDSELRKRQWVKGVIEKISKKTAKVISPMLQETEIMRNIPRTSIRFDPYLQAPFSLKAPKTKGFEDEDLNKLDEWVKGKSWRELFKHPQECNRFVRSMAKRLLSEHSHITKDSVEGTP
jgi:hypothetical protein